MNDYNPLRCLWKSQTNGHCCHIHPWFMKYTVAVIRTPKGPHLRKCNPFCMIYAKHTQMGTPMRAGLVDLDMCIEQYGVFGPLVFILANLGRVMEIPLPGCLGIITKVIAVSILWLNCLTQNIHSLPHLKKNTDVILIIFSMQWITLQWTAPIPP